MAADNTSLQRLPLAGRSPELEGKDEALYVTPGHDGLKDKGGEGNIVDALCLCLLQPEFSPGTGHVHVIREKVRSFQREYFPEPQPLTDVRSEAE
jgi:hypothetical protein